MGLRTSDSRSCHLFFPHGPVFGGRDFIPQTRAVALSISHGFAIVRVVLAPGRCGRNDPSRAHSPLAYSQLLTAVDTFPPGVTRFPIMVATKPSGGKPAVASLQVVK